MWLRLSIGLGFMSLAFFLPVDEQRAELRQYKKQATNRPDGFY
jgi:hypothetical protein